MYPTRDMVGKLIEVWTRHSLSPLFSRNVDIFIYIHLIYIDSDRDLEAILPLL